MVNLERNLNILKGRLYTTEGLPTADDVFDNWMSVPSQANAEAALSSIRAVFGVFNYMNANQARRQQVHDDRGSALAQFDDLYGRVSTVFVFFMVLLRLQITGATLPATDF
jgi:hypothetical protein